MFQPPPPSIPVSPQQQQQPQSSFSSQTLHPTNPEGGRESVERIKEMKKEEDELLMARQDAAPAEPNEVPRQNVFDDRPPLVKAKYYERLATNAFNRGDFKKSYLHYSRAAEIYDAMIPNTPSNPAVCALRSSVPITTTLVKLRDLCRTQAGAVEEIEKAVEALNEFISAQQKNTLPDPANMTLPELIDYAKRYRIANKATSDLMNTLVARVEELSQQLESMKMANNQISVDK